MEHAILLAGDNVTPPARTPWGGHNIARIYKAALGLPDGTVVGESWEVSAGPEFPSQVDGKGKSLQQVIASSPAAILGAEAARGSTALLVKLLDAAEPLSVQIHPFDDDPALAADESGKPESWYVAHAEPGAGIFLGLSEDATPEKMAAVLASGGDASKLLGFIPAKVGDFFVVDAGTAHAIGPGVTLVEPQIVAPGRKGVTYRYWDWNRRYDAAGKQSVDGQPRALHVERALAVTDWKRARGDAFLAQVRHRAGLPDVGGALKVEALCGPQGPVQSHFLAAWRAVGTGVMALPAFNRLRSFTVLDGEALLVGGGVETRVGRGRSAVIPASATSLVVRGEGLHAVLASAL